MDFRYHFLTLCKPWAHSMTSRDINATRRLAEASWKRDNCMWNGFVVSEEAQHNHDSFDMFVRHGISPDEMNYIFNKTRYKCVLSFIVNRLPIFTVVK